jgi:hypothetical protein
MSFDSEVSFQWGDGGAVEVRGSGCSVSSDSMRGFGFGGPACGFVTTDSE